MVSCLDFVKPLDKGIACLLVIVSLAQYNLNFRLIKHDLLT